MKEWLYQMLILRIPEIQQRYDRKQKTGSLQALVLAVWLNIRYYLLLQRESLGAEKALYTKGSESSRLKKETPEAFAEKLLSYEIVSFDVFDTLLFRPFSRPEDLFYLVGAGLGYPNFRQLRIAAERRAREKKIKEEATGEVTFAEIWEELEQETGIPKEQGMQIEWQWEQRCCFANPYMLRVVKHLLQAAGKTCIAVSDMYLGKQRLQTLLTKCGYEGFKSCFVSCEYGKSKYDGSLYEIVCETLGKEKQYVHVGDQMEADYHQAVRQGFSAVWYPNVQKEGQRYRAEELSELTGSVYRALVNQRFYGGSETATVLYEYGFAYGGLFAVGYCRFIHREAKAHGADRILFLARDGAVLKQVYEMLYPEEAEQTRYAYWSRLAAVKLAAEFYRHEYFERFLFHKAGQEYTVGQALETMELGHLAEAFYESEKVHVEEKLTYRNAKKVKEYCIAHWDEVLFCYREQQEAAGGYYRELLAGSRRAVAVDIGWAGSGMMMLDTLVRRAWGIPCELYGVLAGTTGAYSSERDFGMEYALQGRLTSYLYSQWENRDIWKFHNAAKLHNLYWELLLGNTEGSLLGFYPSREKGYELRLRDNQTDLSAVREIHRGIVAFAERFQAVERQLGQTLFISGRDAYAPMLLVEGRKNKKYRKRLEEFLDEIPIG